jgi:hypothetical protein
MAGMFDFLGGSQYSGNGLRMKPQSMYEDGVGFQPPMASMPQGEGMTMASMPQDFGQISGGNNSMMAGRMPMMMASQMLSAGQPKAVPIAQNNIPMGRNMTYQDIMKMYGIQGLMG